MTGNVKATCLYDALFFKQILFFSMLVDHIIEVLGIMASHYLVHAVTSQLQCVLW